MIKPIKKKSIQSKRILIEQIDKEIICLLSKRIQVLREIKIIKEILNIAIHDKKRERFLLKKAQSYTRRKNQKIILAMYKKILDCSLDFLRQ